MNASAVWAICGAIGIGALLTGFSAPSNAQAQGACSVALSGGEPVQSGDATLLYAGDAQCATQAGSGSVIDSVPISAQIPPQSTVVSQDVFQANSIKTRPTLALPAPSLPRVASAPVIAAPTVMVVDLPTPPSIVATAPVAAPTMVLPSTQASTQALPNNGASLTQQYTSILKTGQGIMLPDVLFNGSSAQLPDEARTALAAAATAMNSVGGNFIVNGFASAEGAPELNDRLSLARAQVAGRELEKLGVPLQSLYVVGHGGTTLFGPIAKNNRRVTIAPVPL